MMSPLFALVCLAVGQRFTLERNGGELTLIAGRERIALSGPQSSRLQLMNGQELRLRVLPDMHHELQLVRRRKVSGTLDIQMLLEEWLKKDALWGPAKAANDLRYFHKGAGGLRGELTDFLTLGRDGALAILNLRHLGPSGQPIRRQVQVRIGTRPALSIQFLRLLVDRAAEYGEVSIRQFQIGSRRYLLDRELYALKGQGLGSSIMPVSLQLSAVAVTPNGCVVLRKSMERRIVALDARRRKAIALPEGWFVGGRSHSNWILVEQGDGRKALRIPDLKVKAVPAQSSLTWGDCAIRWTNDRVSVVSLLTGKTLANLRVPRH
ncbi:MAG: hypothetical protein ACAH95_01450 [Fimbriimonas sp.]